MWARMIEFALGLWLSVSPYVFGYAYDAALQWVNDYACATLIAVLSLASYKRSLSRLHLLNVVIAVWLIGVGFFAHATPPPPAFQNYVCIGLLLGMFAIIPSRCDIPPRRWRAYYREKSLES